MRNMGQAEIISAISSNNSDWGGMWAPNTYTVEERAGARMLCSGKDSGAFVPGALIARGDFARDNPELVARFLAVYLRAWTWANANRPEALRMMKDFYAKGGVSISDAAMAKEFDTRPTFSLQEQLRVMNRSGGTSQMDQWFTALAQFMRETGAVQQVPAAGDFVTDEFMKRVQADPMLRDFVARTN